MDPSGDISCDASSRHVVYVRSRVRARMLVEGLRWAGQQFEVAPNAGPGVGVAVCVVLFLPVLAYNEP